MAKNVGRARACKSAVLVQPVVSLETGLIGAYLSTTLYTLADVDAETTMFMGPPVQQHSGKLQTEITRSGLWLNGAWQTYLASNSKPIFCLATDTSQAIVTTMKMKTLTSS